MVGVALLALPRLVCCLVLAVGSCTTVEIQVAVAFTSHKGVTSA